MQSYVFLIITLLLACTVVVAIIAVIVSPPHFKPKRKKLPVGITFTSEEEANPVEVAGTIPVVPYLTLDYNAMKDAWQVILVTDKGKTNVFKTNYKDGILAKAAMERYAKKNNLKYY